MQFIAPFSYDRSPFDDLHTLMDSFPSDLTYSPFMLVRSNSTEPRHGHRVQKLLGTTPRALVRQRHDDSTVATANEFTVKVDVQHFKPEEITLKVVGDNLITVEAKHEEDNEHGHIFRHFVRKYSLPKGYDINGIKSTLTADGHLAIIAPKAQEDGLTERHINIERLPIKDTTANKEQVEENKGGAE